MRRLKSLTARTLTLLLCGLLLFPPQLFAASPTPSGATSTTVTSAPNGVPVVNIAAPSASGLSHNKFTSYNVDPQGLILNNGDTSQSHRVSQLGGVVAANPNLAAGNQASVILNEVTGGAGSTLAGFTEVLGGKADVIVANPFGITCNGCGFLNTDKVSLVTGAPTFTGGALGFNVQGGTITIGGTGLNASGQQMLNLVARRVVLGGQANAQSLNVVAGTNAWDYASGTTSAIASDGSPVPTYAIDASALGAMYAGRIALKSTEAGVGVRMQNQAAATSDDFTITGAGKIELTGKLSAARDLAVTSTSTNAGAITATDANLSATRNLSLSATSGGATLTGGGLVAGGQLSYDLGSLTDTASATAGITDANKRYGATASLTGSGAWTVDGVYYGAGSTLAMAARSLQLGGSAAPTFYSGGTMNLSAVDGLTVTNAGLQSVGDMTLSATGATSGSGLLAFDSAALVKSTAGNLYLNAKRKLTNAGTLATTTGDIVIRAGTGTGGLTFPVQDGLINSGSIGAARNLDFADFNGAGTAQVELSGASKMGGATASLQAMYVSLQDTAVLSTTGDMTLTLNSGSSNVAAGAKILGATGGAGTLRFVGNSGGWVGVDNSGLIHSGWDLVSAQMGISGGTIGAAHDLTLPSADRMYGNYLAGHDLTITAVGDLNLMANGDGSPGAVVSAGNDVSLSGYRVRNWGTINAGRDITINTIGDYFFNAIGDATTIGLLYLSVDASGWIVVRHTAYNPQIVAGRAITIHGGSSRSENVGLISAPTVNMSGNRLINGGTIRGGSVNLSYGALDVAGAGTSGTGAATAASLSPVPTPGGVSFGGVTITLPTTPSGLFVPSQSNTSGYLVESNPQYTNIDNYLGSDYLAEKYNFKADDVTKRLGDAAYETYLVRQQLVTLAGSNMVVAGAVSEKAQMQALMDSAGTQAKTLGLTYGQALSASQQASLKSDMVWMVETTVNGQKVLAPVVYLAASTRELFNGSAGGGLIAGDTVNANVGALTNAGTIRGATVNVSATGDVQNLGGTITGQNVNVASTGGSVINSATVNEQIIQRGDGHIDLKTTVGKAGTISGTNVNVAAAKNVENVGGSIKGQDVAVSAGGDVVNSAVVATNVSGSQYRETVAATGSIESAGGLKIQAGRDVQNLGGQMSAGGDASIGAGRDVVLDTVALTNRDSSTSSTRSFIKNEDKRTTTTSVTQVKGGVSTGGGLTITSGRDVTLGAAQNTAGGSMTIDAGSDVNVLARSDAVQTLTESNGSGLGVGGGLLGMEKKTTDQFASRATGTSLSTGPANTAGAGATGAGSGGKGGDITLGAGGTATLEGAKVNSGGSVNIAATDVRVLEARDVDLVTTHTESTGFLSTSGSGSGSGGTQAQAASSGASAGASYSGSATGLDLMKKTTQDTFDETTRAVGTQIASGGTVNITAKNDATLRGADVKAGGDVNLSGNTVNIEAAQDTSYSTSTTDTTKVGLYAGTNNKASAQADPDASASAGYTGVKAGVGASSQAEATTQNTLDVMRTAKTTTTTADITNQGSSVAAGGSLNIKSAETLAVQGSDLAGGKGVNLSAKDMSFTAAQDLHTTSTNTDATSAGLYLDGKAEASASTTAGAKAGVTGAGAGANASANAAAKASVGVQGRNTVSSESSGTSTARVATITSGGSITRTAENSITDVGTAIDAAGDFSQKAATYTNQAAQNTSWSSSDSTTNAAKLGLYGKAEAGANAEAGAKGGIGLSGVGANAGGSTEVTAKVGAGISASYSRDASSETAGSSQAVVSTIKSGGKLSSTTSGATSLEGAQLSGGQGVELGAQSLTFTAAKNTTSSTSSSGTIDAAAEVGVSRGTGKGVDVDLSAAVTGASARSGSSTAVAGNISSGGDVVLRTGGDTTLEGVGLRSKGDTTVAAGGNLNYTAARDTASSSESSYNASAGFSADKSASGTGAGASSSSGVSANAAGGYAQSSSQSSTARAGSVDAGGTLTMTAGKDATFEGTALKSGGDATIGAGGSVSMNAARSTASSDSLSVQAGVGGGKQTETSASGTSGQRTTDVQVGVGVANSSSDTAQAGSVSSGGNLKIASGKDMTLEGTDLSAAKAASLAAGGDVTLKAAESTSSSFGVNAGVDYSGTKSTQNAAQAPAAKKNTGTGGTQGSDGSAQSDKDLATWQGKQASVVEELKAKQAEKAAADPVGSAASASGTTGSALASGTGTAQPSGAANSGGDTSRMVVNRGIGNENARNTGLRSNGGVSVDAGLTNDSDTTRKGVTITTGTGGISISSGGNVSVSGGSGTGEQSRLATDGALSVQSGGTTTMKDTVTDAKGGSSGAPQ
jgi:filamentous hemagglutinin family protein